ncbi:uncharacterized protein LOC129788842 [Lutzomyia longipalpis]|uniref:Uncharacterized protein n=1 Tax=Lutzomyia longipalpis TaxID=7200 RepID=A0A1B0CP97_LUTLO|nr:uncharacterized protein LOC129788842 [Lutzomyia longipalpis]
MDVYNVYLGDCMSYSSMRSPVYRDFEKFPYGTLESSFKPTANASSSANSYYNQGGHSKSTAGGNKGVVDKVRKESCPFCKEQKKRPLVAYMRKRENRQQKESICEADEHEE